MTHNKTIKGRGFMPSSFSFLFYAGPPTFGLRLGKGRKAPDIVQKQQAEGDKIR